MLLLLAQGVTAEIKALTLLGKRPQARHPYDLGACNNLHAICGDNPLAWVVPPLRPTRGGTQYVTAFDMAASDIDFDAYL